MLFELITNRQIRAVACQDEDRLFRDVTQIQVNIFIEACRSANVLVITPSMVYDFADPLIGSFHARQFRFKSEMAAEYINSVIHGKLHRAKQRLVMEGRWAGTGVPLGYMVDMRKALPDGSRNQHWRRYVPFEPYAAAIQEYFRLFLASAGNLRSTARHIRDHGPWYPDPKICLPPEGFKVVYKLRTYGKGYCPGRTGLLQLLTNVAYIGHWVVNDAVVRWNNHPAIVPKEEFLRAYNYLSPVTMDGLPNPAYRPPRDDARPSREEGRPAERPLCTGLLFSQRQDEWRRVGTGWVQSLQHYAYLMRDRDHINEYIWSKAARYVDDAIAQVLRDKLASTFDSKVWEQTVSALGENHEAQRKVKVAQLASLEQVMANQVLSLDTVTSPDLIAAVQARYEGAKAERERLLRDINAVDNQSQQLEAVLALKTSYGPALDNWPNMTRDEKRTVLQAFIERIEATPIEDQGLQLVIRWRDSSRDELRLPKQATTGIQWLPEETDCLLQLIDASASQLEIAQAFPERKWTHIRDKVRQIRGLGLTIRPKPIKDHESYQDYCRHTDPVTGENMASVTCSGTGRHDGPARFRPAEASGRLRLSRHG